MKKILTYLYLFPLVLQARPVLAVDPLEGLQQVGTQVYGSSAPADIKVTIGNIVQALLGFIGMIFLILIIFGGIQWMLSGGNEKKIEEAKGRIVSATIGLVIIVMAYSIAFSITKYLAGAVSDAQPSAGSGGT